MHHAPILHHKIIVSCFVKKQKKRKMKTGMIKNQDNSIT